MLGGLLRRTTKPSSFTVLVEQATSEANVSENWDMYLQICEHIVQQPDGYKEGAKAIKTRLLATKNPKVALLTLSLLEFCVNNCGHQFYTIVLNKDLHEILKYMQTAGLDESIRIKTLDLIQVWATATATDGTVQNVRDEYNKLKHQGIPFPPRNLEEMTPISLSPSSTVLPRAPQVVAPMTTAQGPHVAQPPIPHYQNVPVVAGGGGMIAPQYFPQPMYVQAVPMGGTPGVVYMQPMPPPPNTTWYTAPPRPYAHPVPMAPPVQRPVPVPQRLNIDEEIKVFHETINVFAEMIAAHDPVQPVTEDALLTELKDQLQGMRARVSNLLAEISDDQHLERLLAVNDRLNVQLDAYENLKQRQQLPSSSQPQHSTIANTISGGAGLSSSFNNSAYSLHPQPVTATTALESQRRLSGDLISFDPPNNEEPGVQDNVPMAHIEEMHRLVNANDPSVVAELHELGDDHFERPEQLADDHHDNTAELNVSDPSTAAHTTARRLSTNPFMMEMMASTGPSSGSTQTESIGAPHVTSPYEFPAATALPSSMDTATTTATTATVRPPRHANNDELDFF